MGFGEDAAREDARNREGRSDTIEGTCTAVNLTTRVATVNIGGALQVMPWSGPAPWVGDRVRVTYGGNKPYCELVQGAPLGTVVSASATLATVTGDDGVTYVYPFKSGDTYSSGHRVRLDHAGRLVNGRYSQEPPGSIFAVPPAPPSGGSGSATFRPTASGNYRFGVFMGQDVQVNSNRSGHYWYGTQIADTIPDSATVTHASIALAETFDYLPSVPSLLGTHAQAAPGAEPGIAGSVAVYGSGSIDILALAAALKTGAGLGVGFQLDTGYRAFGAFDSSGSIYMEWS